MGVTGFLIVDRFPWLLDCIAGCLFVAGCRLLYDIMLACGFEWAKLCVCAFGAFLYSYVYDRITELFNLKSLCTTVVCWTFSAFFFQLGS